MFLYKILFFQYLLFFQSQSCLLESTAAIFRQSAGYVLSFLSDFFVNGFPNSLIVRSRSSSCLVKENSLNCTSGLVFFYFVVSIDDSYHLTSWNFWNSWTFSMASVTSTALQLQFVSVTSFLLLSQLSDLPPQQNECRFHLWIFKYMNIH